MKNFSFFACNIRNTTLFDEFSDFTVLSSLMHLSMACFRIHKKLGLYDNDYWQSGIKNYVPKFSKESFYLLLVYWKFWSLEKIYWLVSWSLVFISENQIQKFRLLSQKQLVVQSGTQQSSEAINNKNTARYKTTAQRCDLPVSSPVDSKIYKGRIDGGSYYTM